MPGPKATNPQIRFWRKVKKGSPDECWLWTAGRAGSGYGQFYRRKNVPVGAHRFSWELAHGQPVPPGRMVMHLCDNPPCVNPAHLVVGTCQDNARDCAAKGRNPGNTTNRGGVPPKWAPEVVDAMRAQEMTFRQIGAVLGIAPATAFRTLGRLSRSPLDERNADLARERVGMFLEVEHYDPLPT